MRARQAIYGKPTAARSKPTTRGDRQSRQRPKGQLRQTRLPLGSVASRLRAEGRQRQATIFCCLCENIFKTIERISKNNLTQRENINEQPILTSWFQQIEMRKIMNICEMRPTNLTVYCLYMSCIKKVGKP